MHSKIKDMMLISLFAALIAIGAFIRVPSPLVPFTLQYLFTCLAGLFLGAKKGAASVGLYLLISLAGVPIFAKGGGITYVLQPTFGYLIGFLFCAFISGTLFNKLRFSLFTLTLAILAGLISIYLIGVPYMYAIVNLYFGSSMSFMAAIAAGFTPFIVTDLLQSLMIILIAYKIIPIIRKAGLMPDQLVKA